MNRIFIIIPLAILIFINCGVDDWSHNYQWEIRGSIQKNINVKKEDILVRVMTEKREILYGDYNGNLLNEQWSFVDMIRTYAQSVGNNSHMLSNSYFTVVVFLNGTAVWDSLYWGKTLDSDTDEKIDLGVLDIW